MGLIRKLAVRGYANELNKMIAALNKLNNEQIARILIYSVWLRALLEIEGNLSTIKKETGELEPELHKYPILLQEIEKWISILNKEGYQHRAFSLSIWVHTLRCIIRPELSNLTKQMWDILMRDKENWEGLLNQIRDEDIQSGIEHKIVMKAEHHAKAILKALPPKQLYQ